MRILLAFIFGFWLNHMIKLEDFDDDLAFFVTWILILISVLVLAGVVIVGLKHLL